MMIRQRRSRWILGLFSLLCTVSACECEDDSLPPDEIYVHTKPGVDFSDYKTFYVNDELTEEDVADAGVDIEDFPEEVKLNIDLANDQARMELEMRGLEEVDEDEDPDLIVASLASATKKDALYWDCVPGYWWGYWGGYWDSCAWVDTDYVEYTIGGMVLALADPEMEEIVFGGLMRGVVDGSGDGETRIRFGVHDMFAQYPED
jgi:hypothetical protein